MTLGLLGRERTPANQLADERVVVGQLAQLAGSQDIRARVANVRKHERIAIDHRGGDCRAHAEERSVVA